MFGYLQVQKSELLVREYDAYKSVYCGLCKQLGKDYSFLTRLILSYDCTFYAMLLMSLHRSCSGFRDGRCRFNPLKKCKYAEDKSDCYSKAAALSVISSYYKLKDDIADGGFLKKTAVYLVLPFFSHWHKKAMRIYPDLEKCVSEMMTLQQKAEQSDDFSLDMSAHPTGNMLASVLSLEAESDFDRRTYYELGYQLGRWIYFIDAADDYTKDKKSGCFNPFLKVESEDICSLMTSVLNQSLARAYNAYNLIDLKDFKGIFNNMLLYGFPTVQNKVTEKTATEVKNDKSI